MDNNGIIGGTGFIGSTLCSWLDFNYRYGRNNMQDLIDKELDLLICTAPTGNRLQVQENCILDLEMIMYLIDHLRKSKPKYFVLISTIDTLTKPNSKYGLNRRILEGWIKSNLENYSIIRLPTLVHPEIKKNVLFDLKNNLYLDKINPDSVNQYYDLTRLPIDIKYAVENNIKELNLFSEPVSNREIIEKFYPTVTVGQNAGPAQTYNVNPYYTSKLEILDLLEKYFNEYPLYLW